MYCEKCGSKLTSSEPCQGDVWIEMEPEKFDSKTGNRWYKSRFSDSSGASCDRHNHGLKLFEFSVDSDCFHITNNAKKRLDTYNWERGEYRHILVLEPTLREGKYLSIGKCGERCCPNCGFQIESKPKPACFIATEVYGSSDNTNVQLLRYFRDEKLTRTSAGIAFVCFYYSHSPRIAQWLRRSPLSKRLVRFVVIEPLCFIVRVLMNKNN